MRRVFIGFYLFLLLSLLFLQFVLGPVINRMAKAYLRDASNEYSRQLARGVLYMMEEDLKRLTEKQWQERIRELAPHFGYNIALLPLTDLTLSAEHMEQLRSGQIAVVDDGELLYHQIGNSGIVLKKGPFSVLQPDTTLVNYAVWAVITAIVALLTLLWIIPYWRRLSKISAAAVDFGNGNFNVRAVISPHSSLVPLARAFNTMADRIEHLISSHKELTNAVSHELRTPLSRLHFGLEMLATAESREKRSHYARELQTDVAELEELVTEMLTFARFDREKPDLHFAVHHLEPFLQQVLAESIVEDSPIQSQFHSSLDEQSRLARFEPKYMARALGNLLQNAANHAGHRVEMLVERHGEECLLHIDDDGPGIPMPDRNKVFEPFARLDASRSRASGGHGLGLAIVTRIVQWHGGYVSVTDSPLGGARLTLAWPGFVK